MTWNYLYAFGEVECVGNGFIVIHTIHGATIFQAMALEFVLATVWYLSFFLFTLTQELFSFMATKFITAYGPHRKSSISFPEGTGRTKQAFKDECDINIIMGRFKKTRVLPDVVARIEPRYGDVTAMSFQSAMDTVATANSLFHSLPAYVRDRFKNDPGEFFDFVHNPANRAEAEQLGLLKPKPEEPKAPDPVLVRVVPEAPAGGSGAAPAGGQGGGAPK